jgi:hypothetical protein
MVTTSSGLCFGKKLGYLACPSKIDNFPSENLWDVRIRINKDHVEKNDTIETQIAFLLPDVAEKYLKVGAKIILRDLRDLAEGEIIELLY